MSTTGLDSPKLRQRMNTNSLSTVTMNARVAASDVDIDDFGVASIAAAANHHHHHNTVPSMSASTSWHETFSKFSFFFSYKNFRLTLPTVLAWAAAMCFHQACQIHILNFADSFSDDITRAPPLRDVVHESFPNLSKIRVAAEFLHVVPVLFSGGLMLRAFDQRAYDAIRTFLWVHGALMSLRGLCFAVTLLPDSSQNCRTNPYLGSCHDLVFSGHVLIMTLASLTTHTFFNMPSIVGPILALVTFATAAFIAASRNHYTLDVILSLILTPLVWYVWTTHEGCINLSMLDPEGSMVSLKRRRQQEEVIRLREASPTLSTTTAASTPLDDASSVAATPT